MLTIERTVLYKMRIKMKVINLTKIMILSTCLLSLNACANKPKNPMAVLPASAISLIQLDAQKNPNMTKENEGVQENSALALAMARVKRTENNSNSKEKTITVYLDQDTPEKLHSDIELLKIKKWEIEKITTGPIETEVKEEDQNLSINSVLNAHSFTKKIRTENKNISIQYDETLPTSSIKIKLKQTLNDYNAGFPNA